MAVIEGLQLGFRGLKLLGIAGSGQAENLHLALLQEGIHHGSNLRGQREAALRHARQHLAGGKVGAHAVFEHFWRHALAREHLTVAGYVKLAIR